MAGEVLSAKQAPHRPGIAPWGWFLDPTPWDDGEFTTPGNQGEQQRILVQVQMADVQALGELWRAVSEIVGPLQLDEMAPKK